MNIRHLSYFAAVIRRGTFSGASEEMNVSQSALSQGVSALEASVGARLFDRSSGGARLTSAGRAFEPHAIEALEALKRGNEAASQVDRLSGGSLEIACPATLGIDPMTLLLTLFRAEFPEVKIRVHELPERSIDERQLFDLGVDLAVTFKELVDPRMHTTSLNPLELLAVLPRPAAASVTLKEVLGRGLVTTAESTAPRLLLASHFDRATIEDAIAVEAIHPDAVLPLVLSGAGATLVPAGHAASAASMDGLAVCAIRPAALLEVVAAMPRSSQSVAAHQFLRVCREAVDPA